jgi:hypothetical protein
MFSGKCFTIEIEPTDRVGTVKRKIEAAEGIPVDQQRLIFNEIQLEDLGSIQEDSTISLVLLVSDARETILDGGLLRRRVQMIVETLSGREIIIDFRLTDRVEDVKAKIQAGEGTPVDQQRLLFHGKELEDCDTLQDH